MKPEMFPILDHDPATEAIIEPSRIIKPRSYSPKVLLCFFQDVLQELAQTGQLKAVDRLISEIGENPIYQAELRGEPFMVVHPGVGAPLAAGFLEELIARGGRMFIACGGCGVLKPEIAVGHILIPETAVRDEGTSYAYLPPAPEVRADTRVLASIQRTLDRLEVDYMAVKTWTTDAIYRETAARAKLRLEQGCSVVEMEASALMAVSAFRGVSFGQLLYGGDALHEAGWDPRDWQQRGGVRQGLFWLGAEALLDLLPA